MTLALILISFPFSMSPWGATRSSIDDLNLHSVHVKVASIWIFVINEKPVDGRPFCRVDADAKQFPFVIFRIERARPGGAAIGLQENVPVPYKDPGGGDDFG